MSATRARTPWILWAVAMMLLIGAISLWLVNGTVDDDSVFIPLIIAMILGYTTVGALLASRNPRNPIGWLMIGTGGGFVLGSLCDGWVMYTYVTNPGSMPGGLVAAWIVNWVYGAMMATLPLLGLLFPTGRVPGPRWRFLVPLTIAFGAAAVLGSVVADRPVSDTVVAIANPTGVPALHGDAIATIGWIGIVASLGASIAALIVRFRRSIGEERQQIRWLAYVVITATAVVVVGAVMALVVGERFGRSFASELLFFTGFALVGIGVPAAMGIAVLKYRLYDLDVVIKKTVVFAIVVAVLMVAGGVVLVLSGTVVGLPSDEPGVVLVAGIAVGLMMIPLYRLATRIADRVVYGGRAKPYEVLSEFSGRLAETYSNDDVLPRTAAILADGTGAERVTIWLHVGGDLVPSATWPPEATEPATGPDAFEVRHQGEPLGSITVEMPANDPMDPAKDRLVRNLASQAGLVLRNVRLVEELRASRRRLVAAQDEERRRLERNIHDGAQQQLVALSVKLRLADQMVDRDASRAHELLAQLQGETSGALEDLRDLARGIYPPLLADEGLPAAIDAQARRSAVPVTIHPDGVGRYPQDVEATVYFCVLEALQNVAKYAGAASATISLREDDGALTFNVSDDGVGFDASVARRGTGLRGMVDRVEAVGGSLHVASAPGIGTSVSGTIPLR